MDPNRFDAITRQLGTARSRRGMLKTLGAAALSAMGIAGVNRGVAAAPAGKVGICHRTGDPAKPFVHITVSQNAIKAHAAHGDTINPDFFRDPDNCGSCGNVCAAPDGAAATCTDGACGYACLEGLSDCGGGCVDTSRDPDNCGSCGNTCPTGFCTDGKCVSCPHASASSSYGGSCWADIELCTSRGMELSALCQDGGGWPNDTSIIVNECEDDNYIISNCNGVLACGDC